MNGSSLMHAPTASGHARTGRRARRRRTGACRPTRAAGGTALPPHRTRRYAPPRRRRAPKRAPSLSWCGSRRCTCHRHAGALASRLPAQSRMLTGQERVCFVLAGTMQAYAPASYKSAALIALAHFRHTEHDIRAPAPCLLTGHLMALSSVTGHLMARFSPSRQRKTLCDPQ